MKSFIPPKRIFLGPGPSNISPNVLEAMSRQTIGHLDSKFIQLMNEIKERLKYAFQTKNEVTFAVSGLVSVGIKTFVKENERLPQLISVSVLAGIDEAAVRKSLLDNYNMEIGTGLGELSGKVWRIGLMEYSSNEKNIQLLISA